MWRWKAAFKFWGFAYHGAFYGTNVQVLFFAQNTCNVSITGWLIPLSTAHVVEEFLLKSQICTKYQAVSLYWLMESKYKSCQLSLWKLGGEVGCIVECQGELEM